MNAGRKTITNTPGMAESFRRAGFQRVIHRRQVAGAWIETVSWVGRPAGEPADLILPDDLGEWNQGEPPR